MGTFCLVWTRSLFFFKKKFCLALTSGAQLVGHCPAKQKVTGSVRIMAHAWVAGLVLPAPGWGTQERQQISVSHIMFRSHIDVSLPVFLPPFPFL